MASIRVTHTLDDLETDLRRIPVMASRGMAKTVRRNAEQGNRVARDFARVSAGKHGKHYYKAFSAEARSPLSWEYGPDSSKPQGGMSFEGGSRNSPPHNDLAKSADLMGPALQGEVRDLLNGLFWPA